MRKHSARKWTALSLLTLGLMWLLATPVTQPGGNEQSNQVWSKVVDQISLQPASAQVSRFSDLGQLVYEQIPDLPLENEYVSRETGSVDPNNTLVSRMIRYHMYVKGRPPNYRLDWKLTLADYLGANERMFASVYPGWETLNINPMQSDIAAIDGLTRSQRNQLVEALVTVFSQNANNPANLPGMPETPPSSNQAPTPASTPVPPSAPIIYPQPGAADLLAP
jgi:hypothetical protein